MKKAFRLIPSKVFLKDLEKLPTDIKPKVDSALRELKKDPHSSKNTKKLANVDVGAYRLRIGNFRLRYDVESDEILLHIIKHRKDVYRKK